MNRGRFAADFDVSRETMERFDLYEAHLRKWNKAINLVSAQSLDDVWTRHFADSVQLFDIAEKIAASGNQVESWIDLGSGAGFPGLAVAIVAREKMPALSVTLIESDRRKCVFLSEAARTCETDVTIHCSRVEEVETKADIISARALAPLADLLAMAEPLLAPGGRALFLKGENVEDELTAANRIWHTEYIRKHRSRADPRGTVLEIGGFQRRTGT